MSLLSCFLARRERKEAVFKPVEAALLAALASTACIGIYTWWSEPFRSEVLLLSLVSPSEVSMNIPTVFGALILGGSVAMTALTTVSLAQSNDKGVSTKDIGASTFGSSTPNTNTNPTKHRYWRHRGGAHPHFGSRRVRT
jgi:hypothetical protein